MTLATNTKEALSQKNVHDAEIQNNINGFTSLTKGLDLKPYQIIKASSLGLSVNQVISALDSGMGGQVNLKNITVTPLTLNIQAKSKTEEKSETSNLSKEVKSKSDINPFTDKTIGSDPILTNDKGEVIDPKTKEVLEDMDDEGILGENPFTDGTIVSDPILTNDKGEVIDPKTKEVLEEEDEENLTPQQKAARTRAKNKAEAEAKAKAEADNKQ